MVRLPRREGKTLWVERVETGEEAVLSYRHSVERTQVEGIFTAGRGPGLLIKETRFTSVGSGLPNAHPDRTRHQDGWTVVDEGLRDLGALRFFISPVNCTRLLISGKVFDLNRLEPGSLVGISIERMRAFRFCFLAVDGFWHRRTLLGAPDRGPCRQE